VVGEQLTCTDVTVDDPVPPLPPQAANHTTLPSKKNNANVRTTCLLFTPLRASGAVGEFSNATNNLVVG